MRWGSTKPGELFTGSKRLEILVAEDEAALWRDSHVTGVRVQFPMYDIAKTVL